MKATHHVFPSKVNDTVFQGLTVRDYIAIQAMTGLLAGIASSFSGSRPMPSYEAIAEDSYKIADAMIKQSEVPHE